MNHYTMMPHSATLSSELNEKEEKLTKLNVRDFNMDETEKTPNENF